MFATKKLIDLVPESLRDQFLEAPPPPSVLRDSAATLLDFYNQLQGLFEFRACGAAHHFPWVENQNPDCCPWKRNNPGCTHADTSVSAEFFWIEKIVEVLNEHCGQLIVDPIEMKLVHELFFNQYVMHMGSPRLSIYFKDVRENEFTKTSHERPHVFSAELAQEVERVKTFQKAKSEFFFIICKFMSDRIQEVLLIPEELETLPPFPEKSLFVKNPDVIEDSSLDYSASIDKQSYPIPNSLEGTDIRAAIARMTDRKLIFPKGDLF